MDIKDNAEVLFSKLENFLKTDTVVGKPVKVDEEITLVPFVTVTFGCGTGTGGEKVEKGGALGAGAKVIPDAVLVIKGDTIQMLPIRNKNNVDKLVELVPGIIEKINKKIKHKKSEESI